MKGTSHQMRIRKIAMSVLCLFVIIAPLDPAFGASGAKNVILMISDGGGFNHFTATSYYQYGSLGNQIYDGPGWVKYGCTTYNSEGYYSSSQMWSVWNWQYNSGATDSAAAATAINTGVKTYDDAISVDDNHNPLTTIAQIADTRGKATGSVTTVEMSHATPACVWAHNIERGNFAAIANEMIFISGLDVIMGTGSPNYDNNGQPASMTTDFVGGATTWSQLKNGTTGKGWTLIESKESFEYYAANPAVAPDRLIGVAQVHKTLQERRTTTAFNTNVPNLPTMVMAAINTLSKDPDGFFLMIEGGAVDYANHDQKLDRMIEEFIDFNQAVEAVVNWIETNSSWQQTLLIVTADHESGCLWGPGSGSSPLAFNPLVNNGAGVLPGGTQYQNKHTSQLVPLYARGPGSELFASKVDGTDATAAAKYGFSGQYIDNTDIFQVMNAVTTAPFYCDPPMAADLNANCQADFFDFALMAASWGQTPPPRDIVPDGAMDWFDLAALSADWLNCLRIPAGTCD